MILAATIPVPAFAVGIVVLWAVMWGLLSRIDRIPPERLEPPRVGWDLYPPTDEAPELIVPEPPLRYDLDRIPPAHHIRRVGRELQQRRRELEGRDR